MRVPEPNEKLEGKICVSAEGRPAIVVGEGPIYFKDEGTIMCWLGLGLDGKGVWASTNPCVIAESGQEFYDRMFHRLWVTRASFFVNDND